MNTIAKIITVKINKNPKGLRSVKYLRGKCDNIYCVNHFKPTKREFINICKRCGRLLCGDCVVQNLRKCVICVSNQNKNEIRKMCEGCKSLIDKFICHVCGKIIKQCQFRCSKNDKIKMTAKNFVCISHCNLIE